MTRIEIIGDGPPSPEETLRVLMDEGRKAMNRVNALVHREVLARMARHRKTGHSMRSVFTRLNVRGQLITGSIGSPLDVVKWHEFGTGIYGPRHRPIVPKRAQALRWPNRRSGAFTLAGRVRSGQTGSYIFAKSVRGIRPMRYFYDAYFTTKPQAQVIFRQHAEQAGQRLAWGVQGGL